MAENVDRVRRISMQLLEKHRPLFAPDFEKNKEALQRVAVIHSKQLRNRIAGFITDVLKMEVKAKVEASETETVEVTVA